MMDTNSIRQISDEDYFNIVKISKRIHVKYNDLLREHFVSQENNKLENGNNKRDNEPEQGS